MNTRKAIYPKTGMKFGMLTVTSPKETRKNGLYFWKCSCDCGSKLLVWNHNLLSGNTKACRCVTRKRTKEASITHGMSKTRPWRIWLGMNRRCKDRRRKDYGRYGGRGITVCPEWSDFSVFWKEMRSSYKESLQLDRIDNNGGYNKNNCHWISPIEQANNRRNNRMIEFNGITKSLAMWCRDLHINYTRTKNRLKSGWDVSSAFFLLNKKPKRFIEFKGETKSVKEWCNDLNINFDRTLSRLKRKWNISDAFLGKPLKK